MMPTWTMPTEEDRARTLRKALAHSRVELCDKLVSCIASAYVDLRHAQASNDFARAKLKVSEIARLERSLERLQSSETS